MTWLSPKSSTQSEVAPPTPRHLLHLDNHLPSPVHHTSGHGPAHDFRQHLADALLAGDLTAIHTHIAHAEAHHLVPANFGVMLDFFWGPGPNTHEYRTGMAAAINRALDLAKGYNNMLEVIAQAKNWPRGPELDQFRQAIAPIIADFTRDLSNISPGPRHDRCEAALARLKSSM